MSTQQQLLLDIKPEQIPALQNFVVGRNEELLSRLVALGTDRSFGALYVWGSEGCGKSHLLSATALEAAALRPVSALNGRQIGSELSAAPGSLLIVDDVDQLNAEAQIALFRVFNMARQSDLALLLAGREPPLELDLREDLRTRIGQCLVYEIHTLSDAEKRAALHRHASLRGMRLDDSIVQYLMRHGRRDLPSLMAMLDGLDQLSLEQQRQPTLPLLREFMQTTTQTQLEPTPDEPGSV